jgi:hypothetical protein
MMQGQKNIKIIQCLTRAPQLMKQAFIIPLTTSQNVFAPNLRQQEEAKHKNVSMFVQLSQSMIIFNDAQ